MCDQNFVNITRKSGKYEMIPKRNNETYERKINAGKLDSQL